MRRIALLLMLLAACSSFDGDAPPTDAGVDPTVDGGGPVEGGVSNPPEEASVPQSSYALAVLADQPVGYWRMNVKDGSKLVPDETTFGHDLVLTGAGHRVDEEGATIEKDEHAIRFDGITSSAHVGGDKVFDFPSPQPFTVECWAKSKSQTNTDGGLPRYLFERIGSVNGDPSGWAVYLQEASSIVGYHAGTGPNAAQSYATTSLPDDNKFHHVVIVSDGGGTFRFYIDENVITPNLGMAHALVPTVAEFVLASNQNNTDQRFEGVIDEVAIYDRALTAAQLAIHANAAKGL